MKNTEKELYKCADKAGMSPQTAGKYIKSGKLPSQVKKKHTWRTREDPFEEDWPTEIVPKLRLNPGLQAKTIFQYLQDSFIGKYQEGQLRTLQRKIKKWRALEGPDVEVYFPQEHKPGRLSQSDFTSMNDLGITLSGELFLHLIYHFVLTHSNWETGTVCFSESFQALSEGFQNALTHLGGSPEYHQTDRLTAAVQKVDHPEEFTKDYRELLNHYGVKGRKTNPYSPHENGDIEQRHHRFKQALDQRLMLRGHRDFADISEYKKFLRMLFNELNAGRKEKLVEEMKLLRPLPGTRLDSFKEVSVRVTKHSTITVQKNIYSVPSRLIKENVKVNIYADHIEVWYAKELVETLPRQRGESKHKIDYRHIIHSLVRKPGAFENYKYREDLFPSSHFRMAYDQLKAKHTDKKAVKEYLALLVLAADEGESLIEEALSISLDKSSDLSIGDIKDILKFIRSRQAPGKTDVSIKDVDLTDYEKLLSREEK